MELSDLPQMVRNANRLQEVVGVLAKYGLAPWLQNVRVDWVQRHFTDADGELIGDLPEPIRVRRALTELGTTFIKLGQILSTRPDLVGPELAAELTQLQANTPPDTADQVRQTLMEELGQPPEKLFAEFDFDTLASASIGQVHRATLVDGRAVVVKVQHAGIEQRIKNDLEILVELSKVAETYSSNARQLRPVATATEFSKTLTHELDYTRELRNMQRFARSFASREDVHFPAGIVDLSTRKVLTMERLQGLSLTHRDSLVEAGVDLGDVARRGADIFLQMVFRDGFYHADPHPGNLMVLSSGAIGILDCGMVGNVDDSLREQIEDLLLAAVDQDADRMLDGVMQLGDLPPDIDHGQLQSDVMDFVETFGTQSIDQFDLSGALRQMTAVIRSHRILLPARVALLIKMLVMLEGTAQQLEPNFSLAELVESYRSEIMRRRLAPARLWKRLQTAHRDWSRLLESLPGDASDILGRIKKGSFSVFLEHRRLDTVVNRLVSGILAAALYVGSAMLWSRNVPPVVGGYSIPGAVGCLVALYLGWRVQRAIRHSGDIESYD